VGNTRAGLTTIAALLTWLGGAPTGMGSSIPAAHAQNVDSFYYSNEAALTAGAMVAVPGDEGAAWYNPAGLGSLHRARLNASGTVFGLRVRPVDGRLTSSLGGLQVAGDHGGTDFITTPTTASASFSVLPSLTLNVGAFYTGLDVRAADGVDKVTASGRTLSQKVDTLVLQRKIHAGVSYGFDAGRGVRFGGGVFAVYSVRASVVDYLVALEGGTTPAQPDLLAVSASHGISQWGLQPTSGVQWDATRRLHLGLMLRFAEMRLGGSGRASESTVMGGPEGTTVVLDDRRPTSRQVRWSDPARLIAGVVYDASDQVRLALDADVSSGLERDTWGVPHDPTFRARAGMLVRSSDSMYFGVGAFADPSSERVLADPLGSIRADYYGGTTGLVFRTRFAESPRPDSGVVTLAVSVRYAVGVGDARTARVSATGVEAGTDPVTVHEVMPYFGSSIGF